jgi:hypothetical protein
MHCRRVFAEESNQQQEHAAGDDSGQQQQETQQAGDHQQASAQHGADAAVELQAAQMAAHAIASAYTDPDDDAHTPAPAPADPASPARVSAAPSTQEAPMQAAPAAHAGHEGVQDSCSSGHNTPVILPPDAADLPVQAVLDELDSLLAKSDELRSSVQLRSSRQFPDQHSTATHSTDNSLSVLDRPLTGTAAAAHGSSGSMSRSQHSADWDTSGGGSGQPSPSDAGDDERGSGSTKERPSTGDGDLEDSFKRTVLDSTEVRDEIRQHLQMVSA